MNDIKRKSQEESDRLVAEFLAKGGKVTHFEAGLRSEPADAKSFWGGRPAKKATDKSKE